MPYRRALNGPGLSPLTELRSGPGVPAWPAAPIEVIEGERASTRAALAVLGRARDDVLFVDGGTHLGRLPSPVVRDARSRRVRVRRICARAELTAGTRDPATAGEIRVLDVVPITFAVIDSELAIGPLTVSDDGQVTSLLVLGKSAMFDTAVALADLLWERAQPYATWRARALQQAGPPVQRIARSALDGEASPGPDDDPPGINDAGPGRHEQPTPSDRQLLTLLTQGMKDRAIARHLGIGERTVQRRLNRLMTELGAQTRFQAALNAVRRGWL